MLQRALVTNVHLEKWGIVSSNLCHYCKEQPETLLHLFVECEVIKGFWSSFRDYVEHRFSIVTHISPEAIIFNRIVKGYHIVNFMCLLAKHCIYSQKCLKKDLNMNTVKAIIGRVENVEKYIAIKNNRLKIHNKKWRKESSVSRVNGEEYVLDYIDAIPNL